MARGCLEFEIIKKQRNKYKLQAQNQVNNLTQLSIHIKRKKRIHRNYDRKRTQGKCKKIYQAQVKQILKQNCSNVSEVEEY